MSKQADRSAQPDWRLVRAFVAVMQEGTLSAAARRLRTTQPTVGRQIRELESLCGEILFLRQGTALKPTPAALAMRARAEDVEQSVTTLAQAFARLGREDGRRIIRITLPTLLADHLLPAILPGVMEQVPSAEFQILPSDSVEDLLRRHADIALRLTAPRQDDLVARGLGQVNVGLCAHSTYIERHGLPSAPADLAGHRFILPADEAIVQAVIQRLHLGDRVKGQIVRSDDLRHRHALLVGGIGIGTCHDWMTRTIGGLVPILPQIALQSMPAWLLTTEDVHTSRTLRATFDCLFSAIRAVLAPDRGLGQVPR